MNQSKQQSVRNRVIGLTALAASMALSTNATADQTPFNFVTNWYAQAEHGGFYQALGADLYKDNGLDVSIKMGGPQVNTVQLLAAGRAQCALVDDIGAINAVKKGVPIKIVATSFQFDPTVIITHSNIEQLSDLKDNTILISSSAYASWWPWAKKQYGFTDAMTRPYTFNIQPFVLDNKIAQQGFLTSEPFAMTQAGADHKVFMIGQDGFPPYGNSIACRNDAIANNGEQITAFLAATMEGWKQYLTDPIEGNKLIVKNNPNMSAEQLSYSVKELNSSGIVSGGDAKTKGIGIITDERMGKTWQMGVDNGLFNASEVSLESIYTTQFIDKIKVTL
ncbi:ABC transporter substrate-binding protein [Psychromonas sp. B3M02]|uniref:ABC transporter substrate-binding protein n=1 Tax=Psychromonas sp. B3M02 TaxID=2267226 RepID=UPI000DE8D16A|nr:ABC transporter substrate-binding protein [Psychromonas sp. B3M02]RBW43583.1 ABC transporter substrate-binding protein [Psychromonas sp. B3M02]